MKGRIPALHAVTDDAVLLRPEFLEQAERLIRVGGSRVALHLRGHQTSGRVMYDIAAALAPITRVAGSLLLVNDRLEVVLSVAETGAQVGRRSLPVRAARHLIGPERVLGASVHSRREAEEAAEGGADFLLAGTIFVSASHPDRPGAGPQLLGELSDLGLPRVGIGGISAERAAEVRRAGAAGVAALSGIWNARDPAAAAAVYLEQMSEFDE